MGRAVVHTSYSKNVARRIQQQKRRQATKVKIQNIVKDENLVYMKAVHCTFYRGFLSGIVADPEATQEYLLQYDRVCSENLSGLFIFHVVSAPDKNDSVFSVLGTLFGEMRLDSAGPDVFYIFCMWIESSYRRHKLGTKLLKKLEEVIMKEFQVQRVVCVIPLKCVYPPSCVNFFVKLGFSLRSFESQSQLGCSDDRVYTKVALCTFNN